MENRPFNQEEPDDSTSESSSKKKRGSSKLSRFLSGLKQKEEDSNEHESIDEKPKRFRRLFNRLFPSVVENPNQTEDQTSELRFTPESLFGRLQVNQEAEGGPLPSNEESLPELSLSESSIGSKAESTPGAVEATEIPEELPEPETILAPTAAEVPTGTSESVAVPTEVTDREIYTRAPSYPEEMSRPAEATPSVTSEKPERETVIERGPGMVLPVALVGLEYLGRKKADKKLEKRVNEKISATNNEVARNSALQQELQNLTRQNEERLEALKRARGSEVTAPTQVIERMQQPKIESASAPESRQQPPYKEVNTSYPERETQKTEEIQPQKILEQVADAAEQNIAVERVFERSHEVKDDQTTVPGTAASVGAVMAAQAASMPARVPVPSPLQQQTETPPLVSQEAITKAYRHAMKIGFWSAVMIIILGSIAYLMVK
jgi:hypothetical protein